MQSIEEKKYLVLREQIHIQVLDLVAEYFNVRIKHKYLASDGYGMASKYGDPLTEALMVRLKSIMEEHTGKKMLPTYSYMRIYKREDELLRHTDRESCEYSMTLPVLYGADYTWPICVQGSLGEEKIELKRGDLLIYKGCEVPHWRESFQGDFWMQIFVHFVSADGKYADWTLDKREKLGDGPRIVSEMSK